MSDIKITSDLAMVILDAIPVPLFLVDQDVRFLWMSTFAKANLDISHTYTSRSRGGEVLGCVHATEHPGGCGRAEACKQCVIRCSVVTAFTDRQVCQGQTTMQLQTDDGVKDVHLRVIAAPMQYADYELVMLTLQNIGELASPIERR